MNMWAVSRPPMSTTVYPSAASRTTSTTAVAFVRISLPSVPPRRWSSAGRRALADRLGTAPSGSDCISMAQSVLLAGMLRAKTAADREDRDRHQRQHHSAVRIGVLTAEQRAEVL